MIIVMVKVYVTIKNQRTALLLIFVVDKHISLVIGVVFVTITG